MMRYLILLIALSMIIGTACQAQETFPVILEPYRQSRIYAENQSSIYFEMYTPAIYIAKKLGDRVKKGELLVRFENNVSRANLLKAQKVLDRARLDLENKRVLYSDCLVSELEFKDAEAVVASAEFDFVLATKNLQASEVRAPFDGKVADVNIRLYELPFRDRPILEIVNDDILIAKFLVPSALISQFHVGDPLYILIKDTREIIQTVVSRIGPTVNPASGMVKVEAEIDNHDQKLTSGLHSLASLSKSALTQQEGSVQDILEKLRQEAQHP